MHASRSKYEEFAAFAPREEDGTSHAADTRLYPLPDLATRPWMPPKKGRPIHVSTLWRWALRGKRGVRLQTLMVGGCRCTCDAWALEFFRRLTAGPAAPTPPTEHPGRRLARVEQQLEEAGL